MPISEFYQSETSKHRHNLVGFCQGYGIDIGYGGDPISPSAITIDYPQGHMAFTGGHPMNIGGDASKLNWFANEALDYVYSSHCLEDFEDTESILREWVRVLKVGGKLVILCPDQKRYEAHCQATNQPPNAAHKLAHFGLQHCQNCLDRIGKTKTVFAKDVENDYSFYLVAQKTEAYTKTDIQTAKELKEEAKIAKYQELEDWANKMRNSRTYRILKKLNIFKI